MAYWFEQLFADTCAIKLTNPFPITSRSHRSPLCYTTDKASHLKVVGEAGAKGITVEQGKPFSFKFECLDDNEEVCVNGKSDYGAVRFCIINPSSPPSPQLRTMSSDMLIMLD